MAERAIPKELQNPRSVEFGEEFQVFPLGQTEVSRNIPMDQSRFNKHH